MTTPDSRVAVVTGSAGALGSAIVQQLASDGFRVFGFDLSSEAPDGVDGVVRAVGDVTRPADVRRLADLVGAEAGRLDVLVNNAAIDAKVEPAPSRTVDPVAAFEDFPAESFRQTLETNVIGPFQLVQALLPLLRATPSSTVVNIASIYGIQAPNQGLYEDSGTGLFKAPDYPASKAALISLTTYLAALLGPLGIRANSVSPGGVELGQPRRFVDLYSAGTPLGRMASRQDVASAVSFLASDGAGYLNGHNLVVDGGRTIW